MEMVLKGHQAAFHLLRAFFPAGELPQHRGQVKRPIHSRLPTAALGTGLASGESSCWDSQCSVGICGRHGLMVMVGASCQVQGDAVCLA